MTTILVTGASGFIGSALVKQLVWCNYQVRATVRTPQKRHDVSYIVVGEIVTETDWMSALEGVDVVVHLAARVHVMRESAQNPLAEFRKVNVEGTRRLVESATLAGVKRFIYISSIGVSGDLSNSPLRENDKTRPHNAYAQSKLEAELVLKDFSKDGKIQIVIIRPPLVYGANAPGNFARLLRLLKTRVPLPFGAIRNRRSFVYVGNLVSLIMKCIDHPAAANEIFFVSDNHDLSTTELLKASADALGVKSRLLPVPQKLIEVSARLLGKPQLASRLCGNLQVDISKAKQLLNWEPPYTVEEGLKKTVSGLIQKVDVS